MNKNIIIAATFALVLATSSFSVASVYAAGTLVKASGSAVYYVNEGKRYSFPNERIYSTWYQDFSTVSTITDAELSGYPLSGNVTYRPGRRMVKITSDPKVYVVAQGGLLRPIASESVAVALYGPAWNKMVDDLPDAYFFDYKIGDPVESSGAFSPSSAEAASPDISAERAMKIPAGSGTTSNPSMQVTEQSKISPTFKIEWHDGFRFTATNISNRLAGLGRLVATIEAKDGAIIGPNGNPPIVHFGKDITLASHFGGTFEVDTSVFSKLQPGESMIINVSAYSSSASSSGRLVLSLTSPDGDVSVPEWPAIVYVK